MSQRTTRTRKTSPSPAPAGDSIGNKSSAATAEALPDIEPEEEQHLSDEPSADAPQSEGGSTFNLAT
ncbi:MAG TPA: hypothetical protein VGV38_04380, partial [Pyrinomonadaceae bacterium]|nr:hypothetical protein [Pyrinomonadaceae bacterium]